MNKVRYVLLVLLPMLMVSHVVFSMSRGVYGEELNTLDAEMHFDDKALVGIARSIERENLRASDLDGIDLNAVGKKGMTLLMWSIAKQSYSSVETLLVAGASPNITTTYNAIWMASILEDASYLRLLLSYGGHRESLDSKTNRTVIFEAALHRRVENIKLLQMSGSNMNHQDLSGNTVLSYAISFKAYNVALELLDMGVDPLLEDRWGYNSLELLEKYGSKGVEEGSLLHQHYLRLLSALRDKSENKRD